MWNAKKLRPKVPPILVGIGLGCILYYVGVLAGLGSYLGPIIASGPRAAIGPTAFPYFGGLARDNDLIALLPTILGGALALAIIASIDALLCAKLVTRPASRAATAIGSSCVLKSAISPRPPLAASPAASILARASLIERLARAHPCRCWSTLWRFW